MRANALLIAVFSLSIISVSACGKDTPTGNGLPAVASVVVTPGNATLVSLGETVQLTASARDASGNTISGKTLAWSSSADGVATVNATGLVTAVANGSATITATADGIAGTATIVVSQVAAQLAFAVQPTDAFGGATIAPAVEVVIRDALSNVLGASTEPVIVVIETNPAGGTLSGTTPVNAVSGVATFDKLSIDKVGAGYTLVATSGNITSVPSTAFTIALGPPAQLAFVEQPRSTLAAAVLSPAVKVAIQDAGANVVANAADAVTVSIGISPSSGTLSGTTTVNAASGIATFTDLAIDVRGEGYTLAATSGNLASATTSPFDITLKLVVTVEPSQTQLNAVITPAVKVSIRDALGTTVTSAIDAVTVELGPEMGAPLLGRLSGTTTVNAASGVANFNDLSIDKTGSGYSLMATSGNLTSDTSAAFDVLFTVGSVGAGREHTCGVQVTGDLYCWGQNTNGKLGDGNVSGTDTPVAVQGDLTFATVDAADEHTCGVTSDGAAYCWGNNQLGSLGDGTTTGRNTPTLVQGGHTFAMVSVGGHTCGATPGGNAYCWGNNFWGNLGNGSTGGSSTTPVLVQAGVSFAQVSAGLIHSCGIDTSGLAYCWGNNQFGKLGNGNPGVASATPVLVQGGLTFTSISAGTDQTCSVTTGGAAYCWGANNNGQLGDGNGGTDRATPVLVQGGHAFAMVSAGIDHSCGVTTAGAAYCWGSNFQGALGDGNAEIGSDTPVLVQGGHTFTAVSAGLHTCGVTTAGAAYCWGRNFFGQLGDGNGGTTGATDMPVRVSDP